MAFPRTVGYSYAAIGALTALAAYVPARSPAVPPAAGAVDIAAAPQVDFVAASGVTVRYLDGAAVATVVVRNDHSKSVDVSFRLALQNYDGRDSTWSASTLLTRLAPRDIQALTVTLTPDHPLEPRWDSRLPATGQLMLVGVETGADPPVPTVRVRDVVVPQLQPPIADLWITLIGAAGAVIVLFASLALSGRSTFNAAEPAPTWTPQSWSSNLAVGTGVVSSLLAVAALPSHTHYLDKTSYTVLNALFAIVVVLAPATYGLLRGDTQPTPGKGLVIFGVAAATTVWATLGQLGTAVLLLFELSGAQVISHWPAVLASIVITSVGLLVVIYAVMAVKSYAPKPGVVALPPPGGKLALL